MLRIRIRDPVHFDPWIRIQDIFFWISESLPIYLELSNNFSGHKKYLKIVSWFFFLYLFKNKIILNFVKFLITKKVRQQNFPPSLFLAVFQDSRSWIRDPGSEILDPRSCIRDPGSEILDPRSFQDPGSEIRIEIREPRSEIQVGQKVRIRDRQKSGSGMDKSQDPG